jgi:hypothetical protein
MTVIHFRIFRTNEQASMKRILLNNVDCFFREENRWKKSDPHMRRIFDLCDVPSHTLSSFVIATSQHFAIIIIITIIRRNNNNCHKSDRDGDDEDDDDDDEPPAGRHPLARRE